MIATDAAFERNSVGICLDARRAAPGSYLVFGFQEHLSISFFHEASRD
jgi:hypothetical protein